MPPIKSVYGGAAPLPEQGPKYPGLRILILAPYGSDARLTAGILQEARMEIMVCTDMRHLCAQAAEGSGAWLISDESLDKAAIPLLQECLEAQPSWSDVPVVLVTRAGEISSAQNSRLAAVRAMGNVTLLERPFRAGTLVSAVDTALRSRQRQYQVRELLEQTRRDSEALREAARRKDEFLAMLAHELRNPLSSISHAVTLQREALDDAERRWAADIIARQTWQLTRLVDDLLDVSRVTQGKIKLVLERVDAGQILAGACQTVSSLTRDRSHHLQTHFAPHALWLQADAARLEQIVVNLLTNAAKYTPVGGRIWVSSRLEGREVVITVRDSGIGIPPERIADMFEMFTQGDRTAARSEGGLGIGLPVVKALCELHGGSVSAESAGVGKGSTFTVRLPAVPAPETAAQAPAAADGISIRQPARILVVDDNVDSALGLQRLLRRRGYNVDVAHDGASALAQARAAAPAVVLLDIGLPGMDGYEVARLLRTMDGAAQACLVALTGYGQEEDRLRARACGFDDHFVKPVDFNMLLRLLHEKTQGAAAADGAAPPRATPQDF